MIVAEVAVESITITVTVTLFMYLFVAMVMIWKLLFEMAELM